MIPGPLRAPASLGATPKEAQVFPSRELPRPWGKEVCEAEMMLIPQRVWDSWSQLTVPLALLGASWGGVGLVSGIWGSPRLLSGRVFL